MPARRNAAAVFGHAKTIASIRELAQRRLPRGLFEFIDRGTDEEIAILGNCEAFDRVKFRPHALVDVSARSTETTLFGEKLSMPLAIAPTATAGIVWYKGEIELARAAAAARVPFTLSTRSMASVESIAAEAGGNLWFQLYTLNDRALTHQLIERVRVACFKALVVTVDTPTSPSREYNERNGFSLPFKYSRRGVVDILRHPRWLAGVIGRYWLAGGLPRFENMPGARSIGEGMTAASMLVDNLTWDDIREFRKRWPGPLIVKGLLHPDDARKAAQLGADAVIVSNHGGRNLDSSLAPIEALPAIADAVGGKIDVLLDSGIRRGSDIAKALALGAKCVLAGRPTLYATAVAGELGATYALDCLKRELLYMLAMLGCPAISDLSTDIIHAPHLLHGRERRGGDSTTAIERSGSCQSNQNT